MTEIGKRCWEAMVTSDHQPRVAARLWQVEVEGRPLWQWASTWALAAALESMATNPREVGIATSRALAICEWAPLAMECAEHSERPCKNCRGKGWCFAPEYTCEDCEGLGYREVLLAECGCPTVAEAMGLSAEETDAAFNQG